MTIECYYHQCPKHEREEPFCTLQDCIATPQEIKLYEAGRKLELMGYNLEELEMDNPYNGGLV